MKITTSLFRDIHFVLKDDEDRIVAVISVPKGADITAKVVRAIEEDTLTNDVSLTKDLVITDDSTSNVITFDVEGKDEDFDNFAKTYYLEMTEVY